MTTIDSGWPFLRHVIMINNYSAMQIRYYKGEIAEFYLWIKGRLMRVVYALKEKKMGLV